MKKFKFYLFLIIFFYQICALASDLPQNIKENLGIEQFVDENLKEILNEPLKENFVFAPNGEYFFDNNLSLFQKECLENNASACGNLGSEFQMGVRLDLDLNKAVLLTQRACKLGRLESCAKVNYIKFEYLKDLDEKTYQSNLQYFLDRNSSTALVNYLTKLFKKDINSTIPLAQKGCEQGHDIVCAGLAYAYACGKDMEKDLIKAKELSSKLCKKDAKLCFAQGWVELFNKNDMLNKLANLSSGKPMFIDIELIDLPQKLFYKSCKAGYYDACDMAVDIDSKKDLAKSIYLLKIAKKYQENLCELNDNKNGCYRAKNIKSIIFHMKANQ